MCKQRAVWIVSLIFAIAGNCFTEYSIVKAPLAMEIVEYACIDDYIWYVADYGRYTGIGRLHVPSQKGMFFTGNEFGGRPFYHFSSKLEVVDSAYAAFLLGVTVYYYNGTKWNSSASSSDNYKNLLAIPSSGKLWMLSSNSIVSQDKSGKTEITIKDSIGLSDTLLSFAKDISENVWVINKHQIARFDKVTWKVMVQNDSMNFSKIDVTLDGKICFLSNGRYYTLVDGHLDTLPLPVHLRNNNSNVDERGNEWDLLDSATNVSLQMVTSDKKNVTSQNAKSFGWKNWPEFMSPTPDSAIQICGKEVYFRYYNGFYHYNGDTNNLYWEWLPVNTSIPLLDTIDALKLLPSRDSSMYIMRMASAPIFINEILKFKSNQIQTLPPVKFVNSDGFYEDHNGTLWTVGNEVYKLENSVWTRVPIPGILPFSKVAEDNQGRILLLQNLIVGDSVGKTKNICAILRQSGSDWEIINETNANLPPNFNYFVQDSKGTYWAGTSSGIFKSNDLYQWIKEDSTSLSFPANYVTDLIVNSKGNIIVAAQTHAENDATAAVFRYDGARWENLGLPPNSVNYGTLCEDKKGRLWYSSFNRNNPILSYYDNEGWHKFDDSKIISELEVDSLNQIWFESDNGVLYTITSGNAIVTKKNYQLSKTQQLTMSSMANGSAIIKYTIDKPGDISLAVFTLQGKLVGVLKKGFQSKGSYQLNWNYQSAKGAYILRLTTPNSVYTIPFRTF